MIERTGARDAASRSRSTPRRRRRSRSRARCRAGLEDLLAAELPVATTRRPRAGIARPARCGRPLRAVAGARTLLERRASTLPLPAGDAISPDAIADALCAAPTVALLAALDPRPDPLAARLRRAAATAARVVWRAAQAVRARRARADQRSDRHDVGRRRRRRRARARAGAAPARRSAVRVARRRRARRLAPDDRRGARAGRRRRATASGCGIRSSAPAPSWSSARGSGRSRALIGTDLDRARSRPRARTSPPPASTARSRCPRRRARRAAAATSTSSSRTRRSAAACAATPAALLVATPAGLRARRSRPAAGWSGSRRCAARTEPAAARRRARPRPPPRRRPRRLHRRLERWAAELARHRPAAVGRRGRALRAAGSRVPRAAIPCVVLGGALFAAARRSRCCRRRAASSISPRATLRCARVTRVPVIAIHAAFVFAGLLRPFAPRRSRAGARRWPAARALPRDLAPRRRRAAPGRARARRRRRARRSSRSRPAALVAAAVADGARGGPAFDAAAAVAAPAALAASPPSCSRSSPSRSALTLAPRETLVAAARQEDAAGRPRRRLPVRVRSTRSRAAVIAPIIGAVYAALMRAVSTPPTPHARRAPRAPRRRRRTPRRRSHRLARRPRPEPDRAQPGGARTGDVRGPANRRRGRRPPRATPSRSSVHAKIRGSGFSMPSRARVGDAREPRAPADLGEQLGEPALGVRDHADRDAGARAARRRARASRRPAGATGWPSAARRTASRPAAPRSGARRRPRGARVMSPCQPSGPACVAPGVAPSPRAAPAPRQRGVEGGPGRRCPALGEPVAPGSRCRARPGSALRQKSLQRQVLAGSTAGVIPHPGARRVSRSGGIVGNVRKPEPGLLVVWSGDVPCLLPFRIPARGLVVGRELFGPGGTDDRISRRHARVGTSGTRVRRDRPRQPQRHLRRRPGASSIARSP